MFKYLWSIYKRSAPISRYRNRLEYTLNAFDLFTWNDVGRNHYEKTPHNIKSSCDEHIRAF